MSTLKDFQQDMTAVLMGAEVSESLLADVRGAGIAAQDRLQIHTNNYRLTLVSSLLDMYPIVMSFVGKEWLEAALKVFVANHPPQMACLAYYGGQLAEFLGDFPPAASLPYLGDVARLEWAVFECQNGRDEKTLGLSDWADMAGPDMQNKKFQLVEAHRFIVSDYPLMDLWHVGCGEEISGDIDLDAGGDILFVVRPLTEVMIYPLKQSEFNFLTRVNNGGTILAAAEAVGWAREESPLGGALKLYAANNIFSAGPA